MKVRHTKRALPRNWASFADRYGILGELDIKVRHASRLWMKALMFRTNRGMRRFWTERLGRSDLCRFTKGVVSALGFEVVQFPKGGGECHVWEVDRRYFCVMGLIAGKVRMEIVTHEAVHAGFCYAKRVNSRDLWHNAKDNDEENVCYPAGRIASELNRWCHKRGYYERARA
jgi:hypothetical protein